MRLPWFLAGLLSAVSLSWLSLSLELAAAQEGVKRSPEAAKAPASDALPAPLASFRDSGTFFLFKDEERLATITFSLKPDGSFENQSTLAFAGQTVKQSVKITPDKDARWTSIAMTGPQGDISISREGGTVRRTMKGKTVTVQLKPQTMIFDNFSPALMSQALRAYDRAKGGKQSFPLFILPGVMLKASLERQEDVERPVAARDMKFTRYTYGAPGVDLTLWADQDGKIYLADVPAQHAAYVRQGFEILRQAPKSAAQLSQPTFHFKTEANIGIPMRDGVKLATNIYRPEGEGKAPVILIRTPYKKEVSELQGFYYARRGYAVAIQDCRGRFASPGTWEPFINEPKDGYDTIEWLAEQSWCNGKVGMIGGSYLGWVQWWAASQHPPHLVTIIPNVAPPDPFYNLPYEYGAFFMWASIWWADVLETGATADISGATFGKIGEKKYHSLLRSLPVIELDKKVLGKENPYWRKWIAHPVNDAYWDQASFLDRLQDLRIPAFHQSGWFDGDGIGSKLNYLGMVSHGNPNQKLVLGPWGHTDQATRSDGEHDFGPAAVIDLPQAYLRWFDYWLKGIDNGVNKEPLVSIFVMGSNHWLHGDIYPLPQTRFEKWYLASKGHAGSSKGDGRLTRDPPAADTPPDRYTYDPANPTPDPDFYEEPEEKGDDAKKKVKSSEEQKKLREAYHDTVSVSRKDLLVYVSEPFKEPYTFAGPVSAKLYASTSGRDTDWFMRLMEVDQKGKLFPLVEGKIRARFRESTKQPQLLEPGKHYEYTIDLWQTGITVPAGRRLRVEVASASFPTFSRNLNTGGHNETDTNYTAADQVIYHDKEHPSHIVLPTIPDESAATKK
jgi:putative CocE/NonD family hydrolase